MIYSLLTSCNFLNLSIRSLIFNISPSRIIDSTTFYSAWCRCCCSLARTSGLSSTTWASCCGCRAGLLSPACCTCGKPCPTPTAPSKSAWSGPSCSSSLAPFSSSSRSTVLRLTPVMINPYLLDLKKKSRFFYNWIFIIIYALLECFNVFPEFLNRHGVDDHDDWCTRVFRVRLQAPILREDISAIPWVYITSSSSLFLSMCSVENFCKIISPVSLPQKVFRLLLE